MALAITRIPNVITQSIQPIIVELYNSSYASYTKYRYVLDINVNGTLVDRKKLLPNASGYGIFEISSTIQSYLASTFVSVSASAQDISEIAEDAAVSGSTTFSFNNGNTCLFVRLQAREEYVIAGVVTLSGVIDFNDVYAIPAVAQFNQGVNYTNLDIYGNDSIANGQFMSNCPSVIYCPANGFGTLSFINYYSGTLADNKIVEIGYIGYDDNNDTTGDEYYYNTLGVSLVDAGISEGVNTKSASNNEKALCFVPFGWQNFEDDANLSGVFDNSTRVRVICYAASGVVLTSPYLAVTPCSAFENVRIRFKNAYGVWDYFDFNYISRKTEALSKKTYRALVGDWSGSSYTYNTYDREATQYGTTATQTLLVNSRILTEDEYNWLAELVRSNEVFAYLDGIWQPVNVTETSYEFKTNIVDRAKKQLGLKLEFANPLRLAQ